MFKTICFADRARRLNKQCWHDAQWFCLSFILVVTITLMYVKANLYVGKPRICLILKTKKLFALKTLRKKSQGISIVLLTIEDHQLPLLWEFRPSFLFVYYVRKK